MSEGYLHLGTSTTVKDIGHRQVYGILQSRMPRAWGVTYGDFGFCLVVRRAWRLLDRAGRGRHIELPPFEWSIDYDGLDRERDDECRAKKHKPEEIIGKLRDDEIVVGQGGTTAESIAAVRFRYAPPPSSNGGGGNNALTINPDHSAGAAHMYRKTYGLMIARLLGCFSMLAMFTFAPSAGSSAASTEVKGGSIQDIAVNFIKDPVLFGDQLGIRVRTGTPGTLSKRPTLNLKHTEHLTRDWKGFIGAGSEIFMIYHSRRDAVSQNSSKDPMIVEVSVSQSLFTSSCTTSAQIINFLEARGFTDRGTSGLPVMDEYYSRADGYSVALAMQTAARPNSSFKKCVKEITMTYTNVTDGSGK